MNNVLFFSAGHTAALDYAVTALKEKGCSFAEKTSDSVTHLLLPVPSFESDGALQGGGTLVSTLQKLPASTVVIGGNLDQPELQNYTKIDLLKDPLYIAHNANITAHCAIKLAMHKLPYTLNNCSVLVIGWGRIGKCLTDLLQKLGASVTVAARREETRAIVSALGYSTIDTAAITTEQYKLIFNTAPTMVCSQCKGDGLKIDLASKLGLGGLDVIWARGLPSKEAPASSGALIADCVMRIISGREF